MAGPSCLHFAGTEPLDNTTSIDYANPPTGSEVFKDQSSTIYSVLFDSLGTLLISGGESGEDGQIVVRDLAAGQTQMLTTTETVYSLALSPDGKRLASPGDDTILLWNINGQQFSAAQAIPRDADDDNHDLCARIQPRWQDTSLGNRRGRALAL